MSLTNYNFDSFTISLYMDEQEDWLAYFQEMPNISAFGDTPQEALEELKIAWKLTKEYYSGVQSYEVQARGLSPLLIKLWPYLTFMNTALSVSR